MLSPLHLPGFLSRRKLAVIFVFYVYVAFTSSITALIHSFVAVRLECCCLLYIGLQAGWFGCVDRILRSAALLIERIPKFGLSLAICVTSPTGFSVVGPLVSNGLSLVLCLLPRVQCDMFYSSPKTAVFSCAGVRSTSE